MSPQEIFIEHSVLKKMCFLISFPFSELFFSLFVKRPPTRLSKQNSTCPGVNIEENYVFWKNCRWSYGFQKWANNFSLLSKFFPAELCNCFRRVHKIILRSFFWKMRSDTFHHSRILSKLFSAFSRSFSSKLQEKTIQKFNPFLTYSRKVWPFCRKNSSRAAKTASYVLTRTVWNQKFPEKKSEFPFIFFGHER